MAFLVLLLIYDGFLEDPAPVTKYLYQLLLKELACTWEERYQQASEFLKLLLQRTVLAPYDSDKALVISCDASPYDDGAYIPQEESVGGGGDETPMVFASWTPRPAEENYA